MKQILFICILLVHLINQAFSQEPDEKTLTIKVQKPAPIIEASFAGIKEKGALPKNIILENSLLVTINGKPANGYSFDVSVTIGDGFERTAQSTFNGGLTVEQLLLMRAVKPGHFIYLDNIIVGYKGKLIRVKSISIKVLEDVIDLES